MLMEALEKPHDVVHDLDIEVTFTVEKIQELILANMDEDFFKQIYPEVTTEEEFRKKCRK